MIIMKKMISLLIAFFFVPFFLFSQEISIKNAVELMDKEEYSSAEEMLLSISTHSENNAKAYYYLGVLHADVYGKHKESLVFFDSSVDAINSNENFTEKDLALPYYGMGNAYFEMGKYDLSCSYYEQAYKKDKSFSLSVIGIAMAEQALGDYKSSLKTLKKVKDIEDGEIKLAFYELSAFAHYILNDYKESLVFYMLLIDIDNQVAYYHLLKGMSEMWLGFEEEANKSLLQSLELNNTDPETHLGLAIWLDVFKDGEVEKIIERCTKAIELDNEMADAYYMRAFVKTKTYETDVIYKKIFTLDEIIADFETCLELDKSFNESYFGMAYAYKLFDQKKKACISYKKGLSLISLPDEYGFLKKEMTNCK